MDSQIEMVKRECSIAWAWEYLSLPGKPARSCKSPFRDDKEASFSVWLTKTGEKWKDFATGESGDVIDFWARAKGIGVVEALREITALKSAYSAFKGHPEKRYSVKDEGLIIPKNWRTPTAIECRRLGELRKLNPSAFWLAGSLGTLLVGPHPSSQESLWWLTDLNKRVAEGRTFSGEPTKASGRKCATLAGSRKDFPVGLKTNCPELDSVNQVLLVEGSADYFAGLHLALESLVSFTVAAILGAGANLSKEALEMFKGRHVVLIPHSDRSGVAAVEKWSRPIADTAQKCVVQVLPSGDLCDHVEGGNLFDPSLAFMD